MSDADRQRRYRLELKAKQFEIDVSEMSRVTLMQQLRSSLNALEDPAYELADGARSVAEQAVGELIARYGMDAARVRKLAKAASDRLMAEAKSATGTGSGNSWRITN